MTIRHIYFYFSRQTPKWTCININIISWNLVAVNFINRDSNTTAKD